MDRSWMRDPNRVSAQYEAGIESFIEHVKKHSDPHDEVKCPCTECTNLKKWKLDVVHKHLYANGIVPFYSTWVHRGESINFKARRPIQQSIGNDGHEVMDMFNDVFPFSSCTIENQNMDYVDDFDEVEGSRSTFCTIKNYRKYEKLLNEAQKELYPECSEFSVLSAAVELMHMKVTNLVSNKCFDIMVDIISRMLPREHRLPKTRYHTMKILKDLGLGYDKIDICPNDCILFYKEHEGKDKCPNCGESRYENNKNSVQDDGGKVQKKIPRKVLRYFPLKPRLQRLYMAKDIASSMRWHKEEILEDGVMRHPAEDEDIDGVLATGFGGSNSKKRRGASNFSKISQITRVTGKLIEIRLDPVHGRPTGNDKSSLLSSSIGCISFFDFETNEEGQIEPRTSHYLEEQFAKVFREFKSELKTYFQKFSPEDAKCNPPSRWNKRGNDNWITMCNHFLSEKFQNQSQKNKENRGKKEYEHHGGSKPMALRYEKHDQNGS